MHAGGSLCRDKKGRDLKTSKSIPNLRPPKLLSSHNVQHCTPNYVTERGQENSRNSIRYSSQSSEDSASFPSGQRTAKIEYSTHEDRDQQNAPGGLRERAQLLFLYERSEFLFSAWKISTTYTGLVQKIYSVCVCVCPSSGPRYVDLTEHRTHESNTRNSDHLPAEIHQGIAATASHAAA